MAKARARTKAKTKTKAKASSQKSTNKTQPTEYSVGDYLAGISDEARRKDCRALAKWMAAVTKHEPRMWGPSIVGYGSYHYKYDSGREGDMCLAGFSSRADAISVYVVVDAPAQKALLARLGKHKVSTRACVYIKRLSDVDLDVLKDIVLVSMAEVRRRYPD